MRRIRSFTRRGILAACAGLLLPGQVMGQQQPPAGTGTSTAPAARRPGATVGTPAVAGAQAAPDAAAAKIQQPPPPDPRRMDAILEAWAKRTQSTDTLYSKFTRTDIVQAWQDRTTFEGVAVLKSPNLAYLDFKKLDEQGKPQPYERIVVTPEYVYQFDSSKKQVHIYEMAQDSQQRAMDEGPLPFLFNMNVEKARLRYEMTLRMENEKHFVIAVDPRTEADREAFGKAYIWLNRKTFAPDRIVLVDPHNGKDTKTYDIGEVKLNVAIEESWFNGRGQADQVAQAKWDLIFYGPGGQPVDRAASNAPAQPAPAAAPPRR